MSPRRRTSAHLEIEVMTAPAARHRPLLFQSLPPERNICTPLISSLLTSDTNTSSHTVEDHTQTHLSCDTLTVDRHEASRSTSHVSSTHSDKSGRCRVLGSEDTCRAASQESHRPRRYDTALCNADAMTGIPELKVLDSIQVSSGKPRRRSATSREGNITVTDSRKGANSKVIPPSDALFIPPHRRDGDKCLTPSVSLDLPSPNMSATYAKPTLMIPYNKLRLLSSSVDSSISSIDTCRKENNLYEEEFEQIFEMTREQWNALPSWQQARKKKLVGLF